MRSASSVLARLLEVAKARGEDYSLLLNRFGLERLLHRLSVSRYADRFLLKGSLLFAVWYDEPHRPTRDGDLLSFGPGDGQALTAIFREIASIPMDDCIAFDLDSLVVDAIREEDAHGTQRVKMLGLVGRTRCTLQIDVGFGDAVTPGPETSAYPVLLPDFERPVLRVYPVYTVVGEVSRVGDPRGGQHADEGFLRPCRHRTPHRARRADVGAGDLGDLRAARRCTASGHTTGSPIIIRSGCHSAEAVAGIPVAQSTV